MGASDADHDARELPEANSMKPSPMLDFWQKPANAGRPVALLATTFALEPDFFEQNCLARFLEVSSVNEDTGAVVDVVASIELHELMQDTIVTVLADRSAPVERTSLLWDLLGCSVPTGLLHAKVAVLIWENATRVLLGSANLTAAGYRRQIELGLAADLGPDCLLPAQVLGEMADELSSYLEHVPGYDARVAVFGRAADTLALFRERIESQPKTSRRGSVRVAFAPTNEKVFPLEKLTDVWKGAAPLQAMHLSPFWDSNDATALQRVKHLLTGRPASERIHEVALVPGPRGQTGFSNHLAKEVTGVRLLRREDHEIRTLHAKCLIVQSSEWVAALVGSSNHTKAGLGLKEGGRRHREMNLWLGAPRDSREGKALRALVRTGKDAWVDAEDVGPTDEDEAQLPSLPDCFGLCRLVQESTEFVRTLVLGVTMNGRMPAAWEIDIAGSTLPSPTRRSWEDSGSPETIAIPLQPGALPMFVRVRWDGSEAPWAVITDSRQGLPPGPSLSSLRAQHLLAALATGRTLAQTLREELERGPVSEKTIDDLNPLKRFDLPGSLLRRGRALAASLEAMQRRLERQVITTEALRARLASPLGPEFLAAKVVEAQEAGQMGRAEALFTVAEIALAVGRVRWAHVLEHIDETGGFALVADTFRKVDALRVQLGDQPADLSAYARSAIQEARRCLPN
ncbi:MAG: hypothetical protein R3E87_24645 [Burkholderiaceae bacterium]